jgi:hypothetical protein
MQPKEMPNFMRLATVMILACTMTATVGCAPTPNTGFDGIYQGSSRHAGGTGSSCAPERAITVRVEGGHLSMPWSEPSMFHARIDPNGGFYAMTDNAPQMEKHMAIVPSVDGRISGATLNAEYGTRICRYTLEATRS